MTQIEPHTTGSLRVQRLPRWYTGVSEMIIVAGVLLLAVGLTVGIVTMEVPDGVAPPGPQFFPTIVAVFLYVIGIALGIDVLRRQRRAHVAEDPTEVSNEMLLDLGSIDLTSEIRVLTPEEITSGTPSSSASGIDWRTVGIVVGSLSAFILIMPLLGWLLASTLLFWVISWAFGSTRPVFDVGFAALMAALIQLAFSAGLGLSLPPGILEGVFSWIN